MHIAHGVSGVFTTVYHQVLVRTMTVEILLTPGEARELATTLNEQALKADRAQQQDAEAERMRNAPPVDRSQVCTTSGEPVDKVRSEQTEATGQHASYIVLCEQERAKGFVRPYRDAYKHAACGSVTTMGRALSETYARDPKFYGATFCVRCNGHFPVGEFTWTADGQQVGS